MAAGRVVAFSPDGKDLRILADKYEGQRFNAPNDLVIDKQGGIYFTDASFGTIPGQRSVGPGDSRETVD